MVMARQRSRSVSIRRLTREDASRVSSLRLEARSSLPYPSAFVFSDDEFDDGQRTGAAADDMNVLAAFRGSDLVGIGAAQCLRLTNYVHKATLMYTFVSSQVRGQGVGSDLVEGLVRLMPARIEQIGVSIVVPNPAAVTFFERLGFQHWGTEPRASKFHSRYFDEQYHVKILDRSS